MGVVILTGNQGNQKALCNKIAEKCEVSAIVLSENVTVRRPAFTAKIKNLFRRVGNRIVGRPFVVAWFQMLERYEGKFESFPDVPIIKVRNINDKETLEAIRSYKPDLTVVSGTNLVGQRIIESSPKIVNLHTGISPYVKGGPNCTNWCLAKNWFHLIGNTVMWLDKGIDTGKIISTEQTRLDGNETLLELHWKVMEHAHDLYVRAICKILEGKKVPAVSQYVICEGHLFYTADWNTREMRNAIKNFQNSYRHFFNQVSNNTQLNDVKLIALEDVK